MGTRRPLRLLWVGTKSPWPPVDGGRLLQAITIEGLLGLGVDVTVVFPGEPGGPPRAARDAHDGSATGRARREAPDDGLPGPLPPEGMRLRSVESRRGGVATVLGTLAGSPWSVSSHRSPGLRRLVRNEIEAGRHDVVHVEQVQALAQAEPALEAGLPVVLRAQNVESELWRQTGNLRPGVAGWLARREARRMARFEATAGRRADRVVAVSAGDAARLRELAGFRRDQRLDRAETVGAARSHTGASGRKLEWIPVPFPGRRPASETPLPGDPAVVALSAGSWYPNREGLEWFLADCWPHVTRELPGAVLHVFGEVRDRGAGPRSVRFRGPPGSSRDAFVAGSVMVVPLRIGSGIRMKILEAWSRGVPVVATSEAVRGLEASDGVHLLVARDGGEFAAALARLHGDPGLRQGIVRRARERLERRHRPERSVRRLLDVYREFAGRRHREGAGPGSGGPGGSLG